MIVYRNHIDDFIKCQFYFGKRIISSKQNTIKLSDMSLNIKKYLIDIATEEMTNNQKFDLSEYRIKFTNKFYSKPSQVLKLERVTTKLNTIFEVFAKNTFIGYNVPVDIPIIGTSIIYRDIIDFILINNETKELTIVEIDDIGNDDFFARKMHNWPQYHLPYNFMSNKLNADISVKIIDPETFCTYDKKFSQDTYDAALSAMASLVGPMTYKFFVKNLYSCAGCELNESCKETQVKCR